MTTENFDNSSGDFKVSDWLVRPSTCELSRNGNIVKLEPKVMELLLLLASRPGKVFSRIQLEDSIWPDMVVGYDALTKSIGKLRLALGDTNKPPEYIQTISKKGYRLISPVSTAEDDSFNTEAKSNEVRNNKGLMRASLLLITIITSIILYTLMSPGESDTSFGEKQNQHKHVLIVIPFKNLNEDPQQDYFSRGITDDLITDLSSYAELEVINSRTSFQYHGQDVDLKTLVNNHGVRYVVEGSIRRNKQNIRINVQIIDTQRGTNLWAEQYNRPLSSLFDIQDEVRSKIVSALSLKLDEALRKQEQKRYTNSYEAYDSFLLGQTSLIKRASSIDNLLAREHFERAIAIDPGFSRAYAALSMVNADAYRHDWALNPQIAARTSLQQASHAIKLDPESKHASLAMGYTQLFIKGDHTKSVKMAERTLELDSKNADANMLLATSYVHSGQYDKAEAYVESSIRLNTNQSSLYNGIGALANLLRGDYDSAFSQFEKSLQINPERLLGKIYMVITLVRMNRINEALWYAEEIKASYPNFDSEKWAKKQPYKNKEINKKILADLRSVNL